MLHIDPLAPKPADMLAAFVQLGQGLGGCTGALTALGVLLPPAVGGTSSVPHPPTGVLVRGAQLCVHD